MKLPRPFYRLPLRVDVARLQAEVLALPEKAWAGHPSRYEGNSHARLISVDGGENDDVAGTMRPTEHLQSCPYIQQILASFGVVWSRSRLMRVQPGHVVPEHADISYHWFNRVRVHIPVVTDPEVSFYCGDECAHMAVGEVWLFDNWRRHRVENRSAISRIHLVADTTGTSAFWQMVAASVNSSGADRLIPSGSGTSPDLLCERSARQPVMPPSEVELLLADLSTELTPAVDSAAGHQTALAFRGLLEAFCKDWRQLWMLHSDAPSGRAGFEQLRQALRDRVNGLEDSVHMRTNLISARQVLEARVLQHALHSPVATQVTAVPAEVGRRSSRAALRRIVRGLERPVIVVAAPRSGSTLLFETLACTSQFWTLGGEAHWMIEGLPELRPGAPGVESNRLDARHYSDEVQNPILTAVADRLRDVHGGAWDGLRPARFLEKTPKNALRIPFLDRLFEDARYVFLWRDPRENLSSIIEAWKAGRWVTYPTLEGWEGPWSLLLPPGWQALKGVPLAQVAAYQWRQTNETVMDDLSRIPAHRRHVLRYDDLIAEPARTVRQLADYCDIRFDAALHQRTLAPLPPSRYTDTPPATGKWRANAELIEPLLPGLDATLRRLQEFS